MNSASNRVWMNVTTSANWHRPAVGIVRVERELCNQLTRLYGDRFRKCIWQNDRFVEWQAANEVAHAAEPSDRQREQIPKQVESKSPPIYPILPKRQALRSLVQSILSLMPSQVRPFLEKLLVWVRPHVLRLIASDRVRRLWHLGSKSKYAKEVLAQTRDLSSKHVGQIFRPGDVLISIGLDWEYPYHKQFYFLRQHSGVRIITCCYDLIPVLYPQYCVGDVSAKFASYFLDIADGSDLILCISRQSQSDLIAFLHRAGGAMPPTQVCFLGDILPVSTSESVSPFIQSICAQPFVLFVSTIERRKNHEVLYRAYHLLCRQGKKNQLPKLVFVGMPGWGVGDFLKDIELDPLTQDLIVQLNGVSDEELKALYDAAMFCVFPSLYEGWGLPVGEALAQGKVVICSDRGSLPEVGGNLVIYVDPWNAQAWAEEIYRMITDVEWRREWERKVKDGYRPRTWEDVGLSVKSATDKLIA